MHDDGTIAHQSFSLSRRLPATPAAVFTLFSEADRWRRWFRMPGADAAYSHDFTVGGRDAASSTFRHLDGRTERLEYRATYLHIDEPRVLVYAYSSEVDSLVRWASLATVELAEVEAGTQLTWTEQVAYITPTGDGSDDLPHLRGAVLLRFNALALALD